MKNLLLLFSFALISLTAFSQTYIFNGNGNWSLPSNWANDSVPPAVLPPGATITISPALGDSCVLNSTQTISNGAQLTVLTGANFIVRGSLSTPVPIVNISLLNNPSACSMGVYSNVISDNGSLVTERGLVWSTAENPTVNDQKISNGTGTGSFFVKITNLSPNTQYYVRPYAINSAGIGYGNQSSFITTTVGAFLNTMPVSSITATTAVGNGFLDGEVCNNNILTVGSVWDTNPNPTTALSTKTINDTLTGGSYTSNVTGLQPNTTYYIRAYIISTTGDISYGSFQRTFTTLP